MKSIMEEASTIFKAVEKAWTRAGKPAEFSVKVYEEPQHNFIGLTIKSAKVGVFFKDTPVSTKRSTSAAEKQKAQKSKSAHQKPTPERPKNVASPVKSEKKTIPTATTEKVKKGQPTQKAAIAKKTEQDKSSQPWTAEMTRMVENNIKQTLNMAHLQMPFTAGVNHLHLKITFDKNIFDDARRQKQFFASTSTLLMQALKKKFKRPLKGYKIVLQIKDESS